MARKTTAREFRIQQAEGGEEGDRNCTWRDLRTAKPIESTTDGLAQFQRMEREGHFRIVSVRAECHVEVEKKAVVKLTEVTAPKAPKAPKKGDEKE